VRQALTRYRAENGITVPNAAGLNVSRQAPAAEPPPVNGREPTPLPAAFEAVADQEPDAETFTASVSIERVAAESPAEALQRLGSAAQRVPLQPVFSLTPDLRSLALDLAAGKELGVDLQELSLADRAGVLGLAGRLVEVARAA
jgi:hypothetical protein